MWILIILFDEGLTVFTCHVFGHLSNLLLYCLCSLEPKKPFPFHIKCEYLERKCKIIVRPWDKFQKSSKSCIVFHYESCTVFTRVKNFFKENIILWRLISTEEKSKIMQDEGKDKKWEVKNCASWKTHLEKICILSKICLFLRKCLERRDIQFQREHDYISFQINL